MIGPDSEVEIRKPGKPALLVFVCVIVCGLLFAGIWYGKQLTGCPVNYSELWERELPGTGASLTFRGYSRFADGIITYTKDGAEYTDGSGNAIWQKSYQMNNPVCSVNGDYAVIIDRGGTAGCIFSAEQNTGNLSALLPVSEARVSGKGVVYAVQNDDGADFINVYRKDGSALDITVKSVIDGDGYPFSIDVDPTGSQLITSYVGLGDGAVTGSVVFRNFGEVGQNQDERRVVGGFIDEFEGHLVSKVSFADESHAHAFYDGGIVFFSTKVLNSPEILKNVRFEEEMVSVSDSASRTAVILSGSTEKKRLEIYDNNGELTGSAEFDLSYNGFEVNDTNVILYSQDRILAYDFRGRLIADLSYNGSIASVTGTSRLREFIVAESGRLLRIKAE